MSLDFVTTCFYFVAMCTGAWCGTIQGVASLVFRSLRAGVVLPFRKEPREVHSVAPLAGKTFGHAGPRATNGGACRRTADEVSATKTLRSRFL